MREIDFLSVLQRHKSDPERYPYMFMADPGAFAVMEGRLKSVGGIIALKGMTMPQATSLLEEAGLTQAEIGSLTERCGQNKDKTDRLVLAFFDEVYRNTILQYMCLYYWMLQNDMHGKYKVEDNGVGNSGEIILDGKNICSAPDYLIERLSDEKKFLVELKYIKSVGRVVSFKKKSLQSDAIRISEGQNIIYVIVSLLYKNHGYCTIGNEGILELLRLCIKSKEKGWGNKDVYVLPLLFRDPDQYNKDNKYYGLVEAKLLFEHKWNEEIYKQIQKSKEDILFLENKED